MGPCKSTRGPNEIVPTPLEVFWKTDTALLIESVWSLTETTSGFPSPFKSATMTFCGDDPAGVAKAVAGANELEVMLPAVPTLRRTEMESPPQLAVINSGLPSPSKSRMATPRGCEPTVKFTRGANELLVMLTGTH